MYSINKLTNEELNYVIEAVHSSLIINADKNTYWSRNNGYNAQNIYLPIEYNIELVNLINSKTNYKVNDITSLHYIKYEEGSYLQRHRDTLMLDIKNPKKSISISILLNSAEEGGDLLLDDVNVNLNTAGQYISFNGEEIPHEVTTVTKGIREVLIIWYKPKIKKHLF